jgi:hypothetical protein
MRRVALIALLLALVIVPLVVHAHILKLLDGRIIRGELVSATAEVLYFKVEGDTLRAFPVGSVLSIHFSSATIDAPPPPKSEPVKISAGTAVRVKITDAMDTKTSDAGKRFFGELAQDLVVDGVTLAPAGKRVFGRVRKVVKPKRSNDRAAIEIIVSDLTIAGKAQPVVTDYFGVENDGNGNYRLLGGAKPVDVTIGTFADGKHVKIPAGTIILFHIAYGVTIRGVSH